MRTGTFRIPACLLVALAAMMAGFPVHGQTVTFSNLWSIATTEGRIYVVSTNDSERGVAYNRFSNHAYIVSRNSALRVAVVDGDTGADVGTLPTAGVTTGDFLLNQIAVADDGYIYAANLTTASATRAFKIYRWTSETDAPAVVYSGNPSTATLRFGDAIDIRGSGTNTEIIASTGGSGNVSNVVAIFRPTDENLTNFAARIIYIPGAGLTDFAKGVAFGPTNTFIGKNTGTANLRFCRYDYDSGTGSILATYSVSTAIAAVNMDPVNGLVAGVASANATSPHQLMIYDISGPSPVLVFTNGFPPPGTAQANVVGGIQISSDRIISVDTRNGVQMTKMLVNNTPVPPAISAPPAALTIVQGGYGGISIGATGSKPLTYQWLREGAPVDAGTNAILAFTNMPLSLAGSYSVIVTNIAGSITSAVASVTVTPAVLSLVMTQLWRIAPAQVPWMTTDNNQRGIAYNPFRDHVLVVSRTPGNAIHVLDAATGAFLHSLTVTGVVGGTFAINMIACSDDGQVFAGNLTSDGTQSPFKLWYWAGDEVDDAPRLAWSGDPGNGIANRWGDNLDVRGSGSGVQAVIGARNTKTFALLDGLVPAPSPFPATTINVPDAENGNFGLSIVFGEGNTVWGKSSGTALRQVTFGAGVDGVVTRVITNYPVMATIGYHPVNQWIAGTSLETADNVRLIDVDQAQGGLTELDTEFFPVDNANGNGTGAARFGVNRLFVLDSNNGLMAFSVWSKLRRSVSGNNLTLEWDGTHALQASPTITGGWTNVVGAATRYTTPIGAGPQLFYRVAN